MRAYYDLGQEQATLDDGVGVLEFARTIEIVSRQLPPAPCVVADIGGGPGQYTAWLAERGHTVEHRDLVPLHVEQTLAATAHLDRVQSAVGNALAVDLGDDSVDAVLLLGPLYHLQRRSDRLQALGEGRRIVRPGGPVFVAAITRWAARIHGVLFLLLHRTRPGLLEEVDHAERTGRLRPLFDGSFTGYTHRPRQLAAEVRAAGLELLDLVGVEGPGLRSASTYRSWPPTWS